MTKKDQKERNEVVKARRRSEKGWFMAEDEKPEDHPYQYDITLRIYSYYPIENLSVIEHTAKRHLSSGIIRSLRLLRRSYQGLKVKIIKPT